MPLDTGQLARRARLFVAGQFVLLALLLVPGTGDDWPVPRSLTVTAWVLEAVGLGLAAAAALGLGRGLTAMPLPNQHARLRTGGLYRWVRHPIYSGLLLFAAARAVSSGQVPVAVAAALLTGLITAKARWEEQRLVERFPGYPEYARRTPRFVPNPFRRSAADTAQDRPV